MERERETQEKQNKTKAEKVEKVSYRNVSTEISEGRLEAQVLDGFRQVGILGLGLLGEDVDDGEAHPVEDLVPLEQVRVHDSNLGTKKCGLSWSARKHGSIITLTNKKKWQDITKTIKVLGKV